MITTAADNTHANDIVETMTGRRHVSWSQLSSYRSCPRRWFFSHVEGAQPEFISAALLFGSAIHSAAQHHHEQALAGVETTTPELVAVYRQAWQEEQRAQDAPVQFNKTESEGDLHTTAEKMIAAFLTSELANPPGTLVAIEETLAGRVHEDLPDLVARIDVVWQTDVDTHLMDLKTARSRWSDAKVRESADQLLLYQLLASKLAPEQALHLHFGVITKAKNPAVQLLSVPRDEERAAKVIELMLPVWHAMKAGVDFASPNPMTCSTCPFQSRCPAYHG